LSQESIIGSIIAVITITTGTEFADNKRAYIANSCFAPNIAIIIYYASIPAAAEQWIHFEK